MASLCSTTKEEERRPEKSPESNHSKMVLSDTKTESKKLGVTLPKFIKKNSEIYVVHGDNGRDQQVEFKLDEYLISFISILTNIGTKNKD